MTRLSRNPRFLYSLSSFISEEPGPRWAAPKGGRQLWRQDPVKDVPLQQDQDEDGDLQEGEEQKESPGGTGEGSGRIGGKFVSALSNHPL